MHVPGVFRELGGHHLVTMIRVTRNIVLQAEDKSLGKIMVLKKNKHRANRNAMLKEVQLMNNLHHKNILKYVIIFILGRQMTCHSHRQTTMAHIVGAQILIFFFAA